MFQFYPTPDEVIQKMCDKIDFNNVKNILEPSAGKGDIIKYISKNKKFNFYHCEIDPNLQYIIKQETNSKNIGYDFMQLTNNYHFDLIIMNPPFLYGLDHFLKAWSLIDNGQICCLLNSNNFESQDNRKKDLFRKIIKDNNGECISLGKCFIDSENKTSVPVTMIYVKKEGNKFENIFEGFEKDYLNEYTHELDFGKDNELTVSGDDTKQMIIINKLLKNESRNFLLQKYRLFYYQNKFKEMGNAAYYRVFNNIDSQYNFTKESLKEELLESINTINKNSWSHFMNNSEIKSKIPERVYKNFILEFEQSNLDFTESNIDMVVAIILNSQNKILDDSVNEIFDYFTKYYEENREHIEGWKTNEAWKVGKKVILPNFFEEDRDKSKIKFRHGTKANDIDKLFCLLSGKDFNNIIGLSSFIYGKIIPGMDYNTEFFVFKGYKKGTIHLTFKDEELRKKFNLIACQSKNWLPKGKI